MDRLRYRAAEPRDASSLAEIIYLADQAHYPTSGFDLGLGGTREYQLEQLARLTTAASRSPFHYSHFEVAEVEGQVVAGVAGFDKVQADLEVSLALRDIGWSDAAIELLNQRLAELLSVFPVEPAGYWTIDNVATLPDWRGHGLARHLLEQVLGRGRTLGFRYAKLDVFAGNSTARRLYESIGFQLSESFGKEVFRRLFNRDPLERMTLDL